MPIQPSLLTAVRAHWMVRLGIRAVVIGATPFAIAGLWSWRSGWQSNAVSRTAVLAFLGIGLGIVLIVMGAVAVVSVRLLRRN